MRPILPRTSAPTACPSGRSKKIDGGNSRRRFNTLDGWEKTGYDITVKFKQLKCFSANVYNSFESNT